jgi:small-conductance mechanosensitive channel
MSTSLMLNMTWLMQVVMISIIIRLNNDQIKYGVQMYTPFMVMAFVVILFRILLIPNNIINIIFPLILLVFTIWQIRVARRTRTHVPMSDKLYNIVSLFTIIVSLIISWCGFTLLAVVITIWWTFQLAAIQTITCLYDLMELYENKIILKRIRRLFSKDNPDFDKITDQKVLDSMHNGDYVTVTWFYDLVNKAIVPILAVLSILLSIAFAADTFEMRDICMKIFTENFIDKKDVIQLSLQKICVTVACYFIFSYLNYTIRAFYLHYKKTTQTTNKQINQTLAKNVIAILVWGIYIIFAMILLGIPQSGIKVVGAGLATGMGFAMKDLLENFFYGISLMSGRLRVGDYIECDGIQGKVDSITYQSTQILTIDGSVIAFLNSKLFSENFKNLTKNHEYELIKIPVGVAYGTDINKVRKLILDGIAPLATKTDDGRDIVDPVNGQNVVFADFGASSVDLLVTQWLLVDQKYVYQAKAKEKIYNILNENNIEIPFPQQDIYIRKISSENDTTIQTN